MGSPAALKRKNKGDDVTEQDMDAVVFAHNSKSFDDPDWPSQTVAARARVFLRRSPSIVL